MSTTKDQTDQLSTRDEKPSGTLDMRFLALVGIVAAAALMRLVPHPWNFTPVVAMSLFGGAYFAQKRWAFAVPLAAIFISDLLLYGIFYETYRQFFLAEIPFKYSSVALIVGLGLLLRSRRQWYRVAGAALAASLVYFLVTNFGAWMWLEIYPKNIGGLMACYVAGLPFYQFQLAGDILYTGAIFGGFALAQHYVTALREKRAMLTAG